MDMDFRALTEQQIADIIGHTVKEVRAFVRAGMTPNPDGTFDLVACIAWKLKQDLPPESESPIYP